MKYWETLLDYAKYVLPQKIGVNWKAMAHSFHKALLSQGKWPVKFKVTAMQEGWPQMYKEISFHKTIDSFGISIIHAMDIISLRKSPFTTFNSIFLVLYFKNKINSTYR